MHAGEVTMGTVTDKVYMHESDVAWFTADAFPADRAKLLAFDPVTKAHSLVVEYDQAWYFPAIHTHRLSMCTSSRGPFTPKERGTDPLRRCNCRWY